MSSSATPARAHPAFAPFAIATACVGLGLVFAALSASDEVDAQGYAAAGFDRLRFFLWRDALLAGCVRGAKFGLALGVLWVLFAAIARRAFGDWDREGLGAAIETKWFVVLNSVVAIGGALVGAALLHQHRGWLGRRDLLLLAVLALAAVALLARSSARVRADRSSSPRIANALCLCCLLPIALGWLVLRSASWAASRELAPIIRDAGVLVVAVAVWSWSRVRIVRRLDGTQPNAWSGPIGVAAALSAPAIVIALGFGQLEGLLGQPALQREGGVNVLVLAIDTLRSDALSIDGLNARGRDTTPNLRKLAQRGVTFENAISQASWTLPAFASILTGRYPHEHGAYRFDGRIRESETTIAELARESGLATIGVAGQLYLRSGGGFEQGCEVYDDSALVGPMASNSDRVTDAALRCFERVGSREYFAFVHYFDPHSQYLDHPEWQWADAYSGWLDDSSPSDDLRRFVHLLGPPEFQHLLDLYDEEVAYTDREIGRLLDELERHGALRNTAILIVVDHGEQFGEQDNIGHSTNLHSELVRVPLLYVPAGGANASRRSDFVETRAVFDTVVKLLGIPSRRSETPTLLGEARADAAAFSTVWLDDPALSWGLPFRQTALRREHWLLIRDWVRERTELFDLDSDPRELDDVAARESAVRRRLVEELESWTRAQLGRDSGAARRVLSAADQSALRALGYADNGH